MKLQQIPNPTRLPQGIWVSFGHLRANFYILAKPLMKVVCFLQYVYHDLNHNILSVSTCTCLRDAVGEKPVTVAVTPNGYADAVNKDRFVMPEERVMPFGRFLDILENREGQNGVFYVQKQNSNFTDEFVDLLKDTEEEIPWASEALGMETYIQSHM